MMRQVLRLTVAGRFAPIACLFAFLLLILGLMPAQAQTFWNLDDVPIDRTVLPLQPPYERPITTRDARDAKAPPVFEVKAPKEAPNVVVILIDDLGFGGTSTFGGVIPTPTFDRLAESGLRYNQFHSTALCSPTRAALMTGEPLHRENRQSDDHPQVIGDAWNAPFRQCGRALPRCLRSASLP